MSEFSRNQLVQDPERFFSPDSPGVVKLSAAAAISVCGMAASRGYVISRIEGGIWHAPGFEARLDCIWDGADPPLDANDAKTNNAEAAAFVRELSASHTAFVLTAPPLTATPT
jgi:hypothetical protein